MPHNMLILYFRLPYFHVSSSTSVLSFHIDVVLTLTIWGNGSLHQSKSVPNRQSNPRRNYGMQSFGEVSRDHYKDVSKCKKITHAWAIWGKLTIHKYGMTGHYSPALLFIVQSSKSVSTNIRLGAIGVCASTTIALTRNCRFMPSDLYLSESNETDTCSHLQ